MIKMIYTLYYTFRNLYYNDNAVNEIDYEYLVQPNFQDILEYEYENKFRKKYAVLSWYLETGSKEFVKELESRWLKNKIDTGLLYQDYDFIDWLKNRYYEKALSKASLENLEDASKARISCFKAMCFADEYDINF